MDISERQLEIIQSAGVILTESGISGLTTKKLAEQVGFSEAALYRHFKGKEAILLALLTYLAADMKARFEALDPFLSAEDQLAALFKSQAAFFKANPYYVVAVFSEGLVADNAAINAKVKAIMALKRSHLLPIFEKGQKDGSFSNKLSIEAMAHIIMGSFRLLMFQWRTNSFQFDIIAKSDMMIKDILTLIKKNPSI
jgi:TetR/AcrR family fatty acid metabolism transcriptional regulator